MSREAFLDTTVIADLTLKQEKHRRAVKHALESYTSVTVAVYALKEFKSGPLSYAAWIHNVLVKERDEGRALRRVLRVFGTPKKNLPMTALGLILDARDAMRHRIQGQLAQYSGRSADEQSAALLTAHIRGLILGSRRRIRGYHVSPEAPCFPNPEPVVGANEMIRVHPTACPAKAQCHIANEMARDPGAVHLLLGAVRKQTGKEEHRRRERVLEMVAAGIDLGNRDCRNLGDAVFAFFAPNSAVILTSNVKDHQPLAQALGKKVERLCFTREFE